MLRDHPAFIVTRVIGRAVRNAFQARVGRFRGWPNEALLIDEPLALAEERTSRLRRIYANAGRDLWDGPGVFREAMQKHGGIQLSPEKRAALAYPIVNLMWGELGAWIVAAELAERLEDPDARMAASSQVFDEARHFYVLRGTTTSSTSCCRGRIASRASWRGQRGGSSSSGRACSPPEGEVAAPAASEARQERGAGEGRP